MVSAIRLYTYLLKHDNSTYTVAKLAEIFDDSYNSVYAKLVKLINCRFVLRKYLGGKYFYKVSPPTESFIEPRTITVQIVTPEEPSYWQTIWHGIRRAIADFLIRLGDFIHPDDLVVDIL